MPTAEARLVELGLTLPAPRVPAGADHVPCVRTGNLIFVGGDVSRLSDGTVLKGRLGENMTSAEGYQAARGIVLSVLSTVKSAIGDLERIVRVVRLFGMVNATPDFTEHPQVINGASDLFVEILGERGKHSRAALGVASLLEGAAVSFESVFEVSDP
jgi:enamine deaminase RidA (YjgF/YER057c/UK114 family)